MGVLDRYAEVLRPPGLRAALLASLVGRFSLGMTGLALLLVVRDATGSYARAGAVSAAYAVSFAVGGPSRARAADRRGPAAVLRTCAVLHPLAFALVVGLARGGAPTPVLGAAALLVGVTVPPVGSVMRALWGSVLDPRQTASAYSLESVVIELCFVFGPVVVAALAAVDPTLALATSALVAGTGAAWLSVNPRVLDVVPHPDRQSSLAGPLVDAGVRATLATVFFLGAGFGAVEVGVLAFVEEQGRGRPVAGLVLAVWSLGSMAGGLLYGALHLRAAAPRQLPVLVGLVGLGTCLPVLTPGVVALGGLLALSGTTIAPFSACNSVVLSAAAPAGTVTEAFAWSASMIFGGAALGTAVAGVLVEASGARAAFGAFAVTGGLLVLTHVGGRAALRRSAGRAARPTTTARC